MVWLIPSVISGRMPTLPTLGSCQEKVVRKLDSLRVGCHSKRENIYKHHKLVLSLSGIAVETFSPGDLSTPGFAPPRTSSAPTESIKGDLTSVLRPHDDGSETKNHLSRSESIPPHSDHSQVNDDPYGIEEAYLERKISQPNDEGTEEITLGTNPSVPQENPLLKNKEALQDALRKVADLETSNTKYLNSLMTTRGIARDAEDQVRKLKGSLSKANNSIKTLKKWLEERDTELDDLEKEKIFLGIQLEGCEVEYDELRKLARDIWIRMSDLEVILAKDYGEMLDEDDDCHRYGNLKARAMDRINIPRVYKNVLADLTVEIENEGKINGQDRIIDEVSDNEEAIIERHPLVDDRNAVVLWVKPSFPPDKLSDNCLGVETSSASNSEQAPEPIMQVLLVHDGSTPSSGRDSELSDRKSSTSAEGQKDEISVKETEQQSSTNLTSIGVAASLNEAPVTQLKESPLSAAEHFTRPQSPQASAAKDTDGQAAQNQSLIFRTKQEAPMPAIGMNTVQHLPSVDYFFANTERSFQTGAKPEKPKMSKAQRREAAMKRDAEVLAKRKAEEEARAANEKKWKQIKRGLRKRGTGA